MTVGMVGKAAAKARKEYVGTINVKSGLKKCPSQSVKLSCQALLAQHVTVENCEMVLLHEGVLQESVIFLCAADSL